MPLELSVCDINPRVGSMTKKTVFLYANIVSKVDLFPLHEPCRFSPAEGSIQQRMWPRGTSVFLKHVGESMSENHRGGPE